MAIATTAVVTQFTIDNTTKPMASGKQPLCSLVSFEWGGWIPVGTLTQDITINLPTIPTAADGYIGDILITANQDSSSSYTLTIVAPTGMTVTDDEEVASSIQFAIDNSCNIEISCLPISSDQVSIVSRITEQE